MNLYDRRQTSQTLLQPPCVQLWKAAGFAAPVFLHRAWTSKDYFEKDGTSTYLWTLEETYAKMTTFFRDTDEIWVFWKTQKYTKIPQEFQSYRIHIQSGVQPASQEMRVVASLLVSSHLISILVHLQSWCMQTYRSMLCV